MVSALNLTLEPLPKNKTGYLTSQDISHFRTKADPASGRTRVTRARKRRQEMFIAIEFGVHKPAEFQECADKVFPLPQGLYVHQFPATDLSRAVCRYEAPSVEQLRDYLDNALGDSSTQRYFPFAEEQAIGLPGR